MVRTALKLVDAVTNLWGKKAWFSDRDEKKRKKRKKKIEESRRRGLKRKMKRYGGGDSISHKSTL